MNQYRAPYTCRCSVKLKITSATIEIELKVFTNQKDYVTCSDSLVSSFRPNLPFSLPFLIPCPPPYSLSLGPSLLLSEKWVR
jgi:hypothetical protein